MRCHHLTPSTRSESFRVLRAPLTPLRESVMDGWCREQPRGEDRPGHEVDNRDAVHINAPAVC